MSNLTYGTFTRALNTRMDPEEYAYPAGSLRQSRRFGRALCSDGIVRRVKLGCADTYFSIPAVCKIRGKTVHGIVSGLPESLRLASDAPAGADDVLAFYAHGVNRAVLPDWPELGRYDISSHSFPAMWTGPFTLEGK